MDTDWCFELKETLPAWLDALAENDQPGRIRFSLKGNIIRPTAKQGLTASSFALKLAYQIGYFQQLSREVQAAWIAHVQSFQDQETGYFIAPYLTRRLDRKYGIIPAKPNLAVRRGETRQSSAALLGAGATPLYPVRIVPVTEDATLEYLNSLDWRNPWGAGSHATAMLFMWKMNRDVFGLAGDMPDLDRVYFSYFDQLRDTNSAWYRGAIPAWNELTNGAMKVLTGYALFNREIDNVEPLIDLCLQETDHRDACHNLDSLYVLHECAKWTGYRRDEIETFAGIYLRSIRQHRKADGGLSFFADHANTHYAGIKLSRGGAESDIHGTHLLVWAITLCANLLGFNDVLNWKVPIS